MSQILDNRQSHETSPSFDGMGGTEYLVDKVNINIGTTLFYSEKIIFDISQMLE